MANRKKKFYLDWIVSWDCGAFLVGQIAAFAAFAVVAGF